jgi:hypothetical protein
MTADKRIEIVDKLSRAAETYQQLQLHKRSMAAGRPDKTRKIETNLRNVSRQVEGHVRQILTLIDSEDQTPEGSEPG